MLKNIYKLFRLIIFKIRYRKNNKHNATKALSYFPLENVEVGNHSYGPIELIWMTTTNPKVSIGNYVSIGPKVKFLVGGEHDYYRISTWPFQTLIYGEEMKANINRNIIIEDDVWIGYDSLILSGVKIGQGSVIGARSIVAKDVPPYSIFVGNRVIKQRFSPEIINKLKKINFEFINHEKHDDYQKYCQDRIDDNNIDVVIDSFIKKNGPIEL